MWYVCYMIFFFQAEDGIRDLVRSRGLGDVYKRQITDSITVGIAVGLNGQLSKDVLSFYPNPATDQLTIKSGMIDLNKAQIRLFDSHGAMIKDLILTQENNRSYVVDLRGFESGIYFVQVITDKGMRVERLSVVK